MKLTLKSIKNHPDMSQETHCFSATIYVDGKKAGFVRNEGCGGCNRYDWLDRTTREQVEAWVKTQPTEFDFEKLDEIIDNLLLKEEKLSKLKRWTKKQTVYRLKGDAKDTWYIIKKPFGADMEIFLKNKFGERLEFIANKDLEAACAY